MPTVRRRGRVVAAAVTLLAASVLPVLGSQFTAEAAADVTVASAPAFTHTARVVGAAPATQTMTVSLWLKLRNETDLELLAQAVSDPSSAAYRHFISAGDFHARYSPTAETVKALEQYLSAHHLRVTDVPDNNLYITATGTVQDVEAAFTTSLQHYAVGGAVRRAPASDARMPAALASSVEAVGGLTSGDTMRPDHVISDAQAASGGSPSTPAAFIPGQPCSTYWAEKMATDQPKAYGQFQPYSPCGYAGAQLQGAYGVQQAINAGIDGSGQTIAIVDAYAWPLMRSDANTYSPRHGLPAFAPGQYREVLPSSFIDPKVNGCQTQDQWSGEQVLDVESSHTMAPGADIVYVGGQDCTDQSLIAAENKVIDRHLANIVSNSWGGVGDINQLPANLQHAYTHTFIQAVVQGIGVYFSSGDNGDEILDTGGILRTVDFPASDPWVTAVGGTSLAVGKNNNYLFETGWSTGISSKAGNTWSPAPPGQYLYGAGGGTSEVFAQPSYQKGIVPNSISKYFGPGTGIGGDTPGRAVPDVAMDADPNTGFTFGQTVLFPDKSVKYAESRIGGTSLASPLFAGMMALADMVFGAPHGFANPALYAEDKSDHRAFHDITTPEDPLTMVRTNYKNSVDSSGGLSFSLRNMGVGPPVATIFARRGYDDVTGVGTPNGVDFLTNLGVH